MLLASLGLLMGVVAAIGGSSSVSLRGTNLPKPDSSPKIFERSIPCTSDIVYAAGGDTFVGYFRGPMSFSTSR